MQTFISKFFYSLFNRLSKDYQLGNHFKHILAKFPKEIQLNLFPNIFEVSDVNEHRMHIFLFALEPLQRAIVNVIADVPASVIGHFARKPFF